LTFDIRKGGGEMSKKGFQTLYIVIAIVTFLPLIFPVFEVANRATPIVLGLPFNFFWVVLWTVIAFVAVVILYFVDPENKKNREG
jgi:uncharacterized membrane protein